MAETTVAQGANIAVKRFSETLIPEILKETVFGQFTGETSILKQETDLENLSGEQITIQLGLNLTGVGLGEGVAIDGNEEALSFKDDTLLMNELSQALLLPTKVSMAQKRVGFSHEDAGVERLKKWFKGRFDIWAFNSLAGNTATSFTSDGITFSTTAEKLLGTGNNTATAPSTNRVVRAGGQANDESLTSTDTMTLKLIDVAVEKARTATPAIAPIRIMGREMYVCFISEEQLTDIIRDTSSAITVVDISLNELAGGQDIEDNFLVTARGFSYRETLLIANTRVANGLSSATSVTIANVKRAIFCGQHAGSFAYAGAGVGEAQLFRDFKNGGKQLQLTGNVLGGMKKTRFTIGGTAEDFGVITIATYAAAHTS